MAQLIVRDLEDDIKARLKRLAIQHRHSMEEEIRQILRNAVKKNAQPATRLGSNISQRFSRIGLSEDLPEARGQSPRPARFDE